jgi:hypothetical protein
VLVGGGTAAYVLLSDGGGTKPSSSSDNSPPPSTPDRPRPPSTSKPPETEPIVPDKEKFVALGPAFELVNDKRYAKRIAFRRGKDGETSFVLLVRPNGPAFYIAENKITNVAYQAFRRENLGDAKELPEDQKMRPAMNMKFEEAQQCAHWMGGVLPSVQEMDYAAGYYSQGGRAAPFKDPGNNLGIKLLQPLEVSRVHDDESPHGVRDLSGNGREWTRTKLTVMGEQFAVLRGRMYTLSTPLTYALLDEQQLERNPQTQRPAVASPYTGFRVAIEVK